MQSYYSAFQDLSPAHRNCLLPEAIPLAKQPSVSTDTAVICIHGFTGTPYEVAPAVDALTQADVATYALLLPGHGYRKSAEQVQAFAQLKANDLLEAVRQEIAEARKHYRFVSMVGHSMGGAIALTMAAEGLVDRCAVLSPAICLPRKAELLIPLLSWLPFTLNAPHDEPVYLPGYNFYHSHALRALWRVGRTARKQLPNIRCPILGIHSHGDLILQTVRYWTNSSDMVK